MATFSSTVWTPGAELNSVAPERTANLYFGAQNSDRLVAHEEEKNPIIKILDILQTRYPIHQPTSEGNRVSISESIVPNHNQHIPTRTELIQQAAQNTYHDHTVRPESVPMRVIPMQHNLPYHQLPTEPPVEQAPVSTNSNTVSVLPKVVKRPYSASAKSTSGKKVKRPSIEDDLRDRLTEWKKAKAEEERSGVTWESDEDEEVIPYPTALYAKTGAIKNNLNPDGKGVPVNAKGKKRVKIAQTNEAKRKPLAEITLPRKRIKVKDVLIDEIPI